MFVKEYLKDLNATQAATRAGYSKKTAREQATRLLSNVAVAEMIQRAMNKRSEKIEIDADYVLRTIKETIERCKQSAPVLGKNGKAIMVETPTGELAPVYAFEPMAVFRGAELLGKHLVLWTEKVDVNLSTDTVNAIYAARKRSAI